MLRAQLWASYLKFTYYSQFIHFFGTRNVLQQTKSQWKPGDTMRFSDFLHRLSWQDLKYALWLPPFLRLFRKRQIGQQQNRREGPLESSLSANQSRSTSHLIIFPVMASISPSYSIPLYLISNSYSQRPSSKSSLSLRM